MNLTLLDKDIYEQFEQKKDSLFFKIVVGGLTSFHSRRMPAEQRSSLVIDNAFIQIAADCYVNVEMITAIENDCLYFGESMEDPKQAPVTRRKQQIIREMLFERNTPIIH